MNHRLIVLPIALLALAALAIAAAACGGDGDGAASPTSSSAASSTPAGRSPTPPPSGTATPPDGRASGIASVDAAVAAMESGDYAAVEGMFAFHFVPCAIDVMGIGGPPECEASEPDGTRVEVFEVAQCEGAYIRPRDVFFANQMEHLTPTLYAIYRTPPGYFPEGAYTAVFSTVREGGQAGAMELILTDKSVSGVNWGCAETAPQLVTTRGLVDAIVPPAGR